VITLNEDENQTKLIMNAEKAKRLAKGNSDLSETIKLHHNAQRILRPLKTLIPFVEKLKFPSHFLKARRQFGQFLSLIETSAFLHQYQREIITDSTGEFVVATIEDYALAHSLAGEIISCSNSELNPMCKDIYDTIVFNVSKIAKELGKEIQSIDFTRKDIRSWSYKPDFFIKKIIREIDDMGYLNKKVNGIGGRYVYRLPPIETTIKHPNTLLHPKELLELI
jgi:hypothetical protein